MTASPARTVRTTAARVAAPSPPLPPQPAVRPYESLPVKLWFEVLVVGVLASGCTAVASSSLGPWALLILVLGGGWCCLRISDDGTRPLSGRMAAAHRRASAHLTSRAGRTDLRSATVAAGSFLPPVVGRGCRSCVAAFS